MDPITLLTSWEEQVEQDESGSTWRRISSGDPHTRAMFNAVLEGYGRILERPRPTQEDAEQLLDQRVTVVTAGENFIGGRLISCREGTVRKMSSGQLALLPKGARTKGFLLNTDKIVDLIPGFSSGLAQQYVDEVRKHMPTLRPITQERLEQLPANSETLSMCFFGTHRLPDSEQADALILASEYLRDDDIVDGMVLLVRPEHGVSEHGSMYGQQLLRGEYGEVVGFEPISFAEGMHLCEIDFDDAYQQIVGKLVAA